jgi:tripartite-type tricarboxylate transporter receptor subunit TctC
VLPHLQAKRVKVIGSTTAKRTAQTPDWPTAQELGVPGVDASIWVGLFAPRGTPAPIVNRLYKASADALQLPEVRERLAVVGGAEAVALSPADTNARVKRDAQRYRKVVQDVALPLQ